MKLEEKRRVIEILLCCSDEKSPDLLDGTASSAGLDVGMAVVRAEAAWMREHVPGMGHYAISIEAAYRLIETSPTLRREWFGKTGAE